MTIKNVLKLSAELIGRQDIAEYLERGVTEDVTASEEEVSKLLSAYNSALLYAAADFEGLFTSVRLENVSEVEFACLNERVIAITTVKDDFGNDLPYEIKTDRLVLKGVQPSVIVWYRYLPTDREISDEVDYGYSNKITPRVLAYGTVAEYYLFVGQTVEYKTWREKFERSALACVRRTGKLILPKRRWY